MTDDFVGQTLCQYRIEALLYTGVMSQHLCGMRINLKSQAAVEML
jgi:hypothetical protein